MIRRQDTDDYLSLFLNNTPLLDVRAPAEFDKGHLPGAINAPLMNDDERHLVGICYKEQGQSKAVELGHRLVQGDVRTQRLEAWKHFCTQHPDGYLYCFRGGLRSHLSRQWIAQAGIDYPLVEGGYKAMRRFLIDQLEQQIASETFYILSGRTGTGKTRVLNTLPNPVDLEGLANHRGSSFGRQVTPQPTQINFENQLAVAMLLARHQRGGPIYLEDESRLVGHCALPISLRERMTAAPLVVLDRPMTERIDIIRQDYVENMLTDYTNLDGEDAGWLNFSDYLLSALDRIRKRLGGERHQQLRSVMESALAQQAKHGTSDGHNVWIQGLLEHYYDPMYDYQLARKLGTVMMHGGPDAITQWAKHAHPHTS
jgi:tRNA 2-selenouridine synthase